MHSPESLICYVRIPIPFTKTKHPFRSERKYIHLAEIWHVDPCRGPGGDDSCGRFMRAHHGDKKVLDEAVKRLSWDWDRTFTLGEDDHDDEDGPYTPETRYVGMFKPDGTPLMSTAGIVINIYFDVLFEMFYSGNNADTARKRSINFMNKHMAEILMFSENPCDSLHSSITNVFGTRTGKTLTKHEREDRIRGLAAAVYGDILRKTRQWWKNPDLHIHHWRVNVPLFRNIRRFFTKCPKCGKGLGWNKCGESDWDGNLIACYRCSGQAQAVRLK